MSEIVTGPVVGGPCHGAKSITAYSTWDGRCSRDESGRYIWVVDRRRWEWCFWRVPVQRQLIWHKRHETRTQQPLTFH